MTSKAAFKRKLIDRKPGEALELARAWVEALLRHGERVTSESIRERRAARQANGKEVPGER